MQFVGNAVHDFGGFGSPLMVGWAHQKREVVMRYFASLFLALSLMLMGGCGDSTGACAATGGFVDTCKQNWTEGECADFQGVNGATWTFHAGQSCESLGYDYPCRSGSFGRSPSDCGE
jgi:hypothetical protein